MSSRISISEFQAIVDRELPLARLFGYRVDALYAGRVVICFPYQPQFVRPGGTVAGPVQMALADLVVYAAVLSLIGPVELAVTTNLNCNFLRRPPPAELRGEGRILKLGKRLAVGEATLYTAADPRPVAHATCTYSVPPEQP